MIRSANLFTILVPYAIFVIPFRAQFQRMITDPNPLETLFMGGVNREYYRDEMSGMWIRIEN